MLVKFVLLSLLFAGKIVCDDFEELEDDEDEDTFAEVSEKLIYVCLLICIILFLNKVRCV